MDDVLGFKDNIDPAMLINSSTNFSHLDSSFRSNNTPAFLSSDDPERPAIRSDPHLTGQSRKRKKPAMSNSEAFTEVMMKKWQEDKEERIERVLKDEEREKERKERQEAIVIQE